MSDEACPSFEARVNQMTLGHEFLETLGVIPTHGWQLVTIMIIFFL